MSIENIISIIISVLGSSVISLILSTVIFLPMQEKKKYIFDEKKRVYDSIIIFCQLVIFPQKARYSLGVSKYNVQELSDEQNIINALDNLEIAIPKLQLITNDDLVVRSVENFIRKKDIESFNLLVARLRKDLYR